MKLQKLLSSRFYIDLFDHTAVFLSLCEMAQKLKFTKYFCGYFVGGCNGLSIQELGKKHNYLR